MSTGNSSIPDESIDISLIFLSLAGIPGQIKYCLHTHMHEQWLAKYTITNNILRASILEKPLTLFCLLGHLSRLWYIDIVK